MISACQASSSALQNRPRNCMHSILKVRYRNISKTIECVLACLGTTVWILDLLFVRMAAVPSLLARVSLVVSCWSSSFPEAIDGQYEVLKRVWGMIKNDRRHRPAMARLIYAPLLAMTGRWIGRQNKSNRENLINTP